jgi:hypothetical protein
VTVLSWETVVRDMVLENRNVRMLEC